MATRICTCFISLFLLIGSNALSQDTVTVPLHIRAGFDLTGPALIYFNNDLVSYGINASADINSLLSATTAIRYSSYGSTESSYNFSSRGLSITAGVDYNFIKANVSHGKYFAGIGMRYGLSFYREEASDISYTNEWGTGDATVPVSRHVGHYLELTPSVRTDIFPGVTVGWNIYARLLISSGAGKDLKPAWMPGYGAGTSGLTGGVEYYISISIPYKKQRVIIKPKTEQSDEEEEGNENNEETGNSSTGIGL